MGNSVTSTHALETHRDREVDNVYRARRHHAICIFHPFFMSILTHNSWRCWSSKSSKINLWHTLHPRKWTNVTWKRTIVQRKSHLPIPSIFRSTFVGFQRRYTNLNHPQRCCSQSEPLRSYHNLGAERKSDRLLYLIHRVFVGRRKTLA